MPEYYTIPDLLLAWPWPRTVNGMLDTVEEEANAWVQSFEIFDDSQFKKFKGCNFNLLGAMVGELESKEHLRLSCDLMNFYFAFDEYTDLANRDEAMKISDNVMDALRHPSVPSSSKITEMARQFMERTINVVGRDGQAIDRFIADFAAYTTSVIQEADDRVEGRIRNVHDYFVLRRDTCGAKPTFSFFAIGLYIPDEVFENPRVLSLIEGATDLIILDMHSYRLEHSRGLDGHNVITAIMHEYNLGLQAALYWILEYATKSSSKFLIELKNLPSWGPAVDAALREYFDRVARCVRGYDTWSYETRRYYGENGRQVQTTRIITLKPREAGYVKKEQLCLSS